MPASATLGTSSAKAFTITQGMGGAIIQNQSAIAIRINLNANATSNDVLIPPLASGSPGQLAITFPQPLTKDIQVHAIAASGTPVLNYILLPTGE